MSALPPPALVPLPDGRVLAVDDVGDPAGVPVLYLHGTPDSRWSRHPDDALSSEAGVRLLAVDRPGCGRSTPHPGRTLGSVADDLAALCAHLEIDEVAVLAWSAGAPYAMALAARHPALVAALTLVAPLIPITAYADAEVADAAGPGRQLFAEMAAEMAPDDVAAEVAPYLVPDPPTPEAVGAMADDDDPARTAEVAAIPGARDRLVAATIEAVAAGGGGVHADIATQAARPDVELAAVRAPVTIWSGLIDPVSPPEFGRWWQAVVPHAELVEVDGASHTVILTRWADLLVDLRLAVAPND